MSTLSKDQSAADMGSAPPRLPFASPQMTTQSPLRHAPPTAPVRSDPSGRDFPLTSAADMMQTQGRLPHEGNPSSPHKSRGGKATHWQGAAAAPPGVCRRHDADAKAIAP